MGSTPRPEMSIPRNSLWRVSYFPPRIRLISCLWIRILIFLILSSLILSFLTHLRKQETGVSPVSCLLCLMICRRFCLPEAPRTLNSREIRGSGCRGGGKASGTFQSVRFTDTNGNSKCSPGNVFSGKYVPREMCSPGNVFSGKYVLRKCVPREMCSPGDHFVILIFFAALQAEV